MPAGFALSLSLSHPSLFLHYDDSLLTQQSVPSWCYSGDFIMKLPRFWGGLAVGAGLGCLLSSQNVKISMARIIPFLPKNPDLEAHPGLKEVVSLKKIKAQKMLETKRLSMAYRSKIAEEMKADPFGEVKKREVAAIREHLLVGFKLEINQLDEEIKFLKKQLNEEGQSHEEEWKPDQPDSEIN